MAVFDSDDGHMIRSVVTSFGYGHAPPPDATLVLDTRVLLRDPHVDPTLRQMTGLDAAVRERVMATPGAESLVTNTVDTVLALLAEAGNPRGVRVDVAVGCVGGRHRSVALAAEVAARLRAAGVGVDVVHRDVDLPVLMRAA